jgi:hypothetical protein
VCGETTEVLHPYTHLADPTPETIAETTHCQQRMKRNITAPLVTMNRDSMKGELRKRTKADFQKNIKERQMIDLGYARKQF